MGFLVSGHSNMEFWTPMRVGRLSERIADRILALIDGEELRPGDRLPAERILSGALGVSRPSLREALQALQARGLVEVRHGTGVFVTEPISRRELREAVTQSDMSLAELFDMRVVLEVPAAAWAAKRHSEEELSRVGRAYEKLQEASLAETVDLVELQSLDAAFHLSIVGAAGNRFLRRTAGVLHEILNRGILTTLSIPGRLERSRSEHERIFAAIMAGDSRTAASAVRSHINGARRAALSRRNQESMSSNDERRPMAGRSGRPAPPRPGPA